MSFLFLGCGFWGSGARGLGSDLAESGLRSSLCKSFVGILGGTEETSHLVRRCRGGLEMCAGYRQLGLQLSEEGLEGPKLFAGSMQVHRLSSLRCIRGTADSGRRDPLPSV